MICNFVYRRWRAAAAVVLLLCINWLPASVHSQPHVNPGKLEIRFLSVGQADATLIRCPDANSYVLIDAADTRYPESSKRFRALLLEEFKGKPRKIDVVVASHAHADHIGSMQWLLENFEVATYVDSGDKAETALWSKLEKLRNRLSKQGRLKYVNAKKARSVEISVCPNADVSMEVFSPWAFSKKLTDQNDRSVIVRLTHKSISFLFVGDAHDTAEKVMLEQIDEDLRKKLDVDVLKVGHHGSHTSSTSSFILAVSPQLAIISSGEKDVGTNVGYKHPRFNTIVTYTNWFKSAERNRYGSVQFPKGKIWAYDSERRSWRQHTRPDGLWLTTIDGTIVVKSDGSKFDVETQ